MKTNKNIIRCLSMVLVFCFVFSACSKKAAVNLYNGIPSSENITGKFAENLKYELCWNTDYNCVELKDKETGELQWCSIPMSVEVSPLDKTSKLCSPVSVAYLEPDTNLVKTAEGAEEITGVAIQKTEKGIKVYYDFGNYDICVPVNYELDDDKISVSIVSDELTESKYKIYQISILPYMVSAKNSDSKDSYLFVPYGSGAIMYTDTTWRSFRDFTAEMYGDDLAINREEQFNSDKSLKLPVFAAKNLDTAVFAIIESGAEYASLSAHAGNAEIGYSNVYPAFKLRGYNTTLIDEVSADGKKSVMRISNKRVSDIYKVSYYLLKGEDAELSSMAELYRDYLDKTYAKQTAAYQKPYYLKLLGGAFVDSYTLGLPKDKLYTATTYSDVLDITSKVLELTKTQGNIELFGFGESGAKYGKVAGGFGFGAFGSKKDRETLIDSGAYVNYEILRFSKSSDGFSTLWDAAKNANNGTANQYLYNVSDKVKDKTYKLLKRSSVDEALNKLKKHTAKFDIKNVSLGSLGEVSYSDYSKQKYVAKGSMDTDVYTYINAMREDGVNVKVSAANDYAAAVSTIITDTPLDCGALSVLDESVPFYSLVFKGRAQLYTSPLNLTHNLQEEYLNAVSCGVGLQFSVCNTYDSRLKDTQFGYMFAQSVYSDIEKQMMDLINESNELLNKVANAKIKHWERRNERLTVTEFDNGITVYTNFSNQQISAECGNIPPMSFQFSEGR